MNIRILEQTLSDGSKAYSLAITQDEQTIDIDCLDLRHAIALEAAIKTALIEHTPHTVI